MRLLRILGFIVGGLAVVVGALVAYAAATANGLFAYPDTAGPKLAASADPALIERGRYLVHGPAHCVSCHSTGDRAHPEKVTSAPLRGGMVFRMGPLGTRYARNLTSDVETGIGAQTDAELARALRTGVMHDGELSFFMRLEAADLADEDIVAVLSYLRLLEPIRNPVPRGEWALFGKLLFTYALPRLTPRPLQGPRYVPTGDSPSIERGAYLASSVAMCLRCHTAINPKGFDPVGPPGGGGLPGPSHGADRDMELVAPNLSAHPTGYTGRVSEDEFVRRLRAGRVYASSLMPWESLAATSEVDLRSIYRYLKTLPPVDNDVGPTYRKRS